MLSSRKKSVTNSRIGKFLLLAVVVGLRKSVFEIVRMFSVGDIDGHLSGEADELTGGGIGDDGDA